MVAGGAGGGMSCLFPLEGGHGGGLIGGDGTYDPQFNPTPDSPGKGGRQDDGGDGQNKGQLGFGANSNSTRLTDCAGAGGGGYYGGGSGYDVDASGTGGGGSSYISGYDGCEIHSSKYIFTKSLMIPGNQEVPNPDGQDMIHYIGQGVIRLTHLGYYCSCFKKHAFFQYFLYVVINNCNHS